MAFIELLRRECSKKKLEWFDVYIPGIYADLVETQEVTDPALVYRIALDSAAFRMAELERIGASSEIRVLFEMLATLRSLFLQFSKQRNWLAYYVFNPMSTSSAPDEKQPFFETRASPRSTCQFLYEFVEEQQEAGESCIGCERPTNSKVADLVDSIACLKFDGLQPFSGKFSEEEFQFARGIGLSISFRIERFRDGMTALVGLIGFLAGAGAIRGLLDRVLPPWFVWHEPLLEVYLLME
jgi:hypothetical protein